MTDRAEQMREECLAVLQAEIDKCGLSDCDRCEEIFHGPIAAIRALPLPPRPTPAEVVASWSDDEVNEFYRTLLDRAHGVVADTKPRPSVEEVASALRDTHGRMIDRQAHDRWLAVAKRAEEMYGLSVPALACPGCERCAKKPVHGKPFAFPRTQARIRRSLRECSWCGNLTSLYRCTVGLGKNCPRCNGTGREP